MDTPGGMTARITSRQTRFQVKGVVFCPTANFERYKRRTQFQILHLFTATSVHYKHYPNMKFLIISFFLACASAQWVAPYYSQWSPYNPQFTNDLLSKSVDLNKDGQPDVPVYTAAPALLPNYYPYAGLNYRAGFPYTYGAPFTYPFVQAAAAPAAEVKSTRSKRQVAVLPHNPAEFLNDFRYKSVDLNQDGQPDNAVYTAPVAPIAPARFVTPYPGFTGYYPQPYPFFNGFY
ncbi:uncharacterized protein LOC124193369 isoform X2 [Daphnia pulex]|uniref:uncharacterized protein LOC124193369 isoform X1 n=1 Tax=Daphnia pulex TaxID=6669 RepID=UPI001EDCE220|nr:uncharacterized protein LOC124193369 isoform X1 [Daphnia pulex]XP_046443103.1 uncharacterized protein LOC124193369 isoform X2 [Daphnia pulex]